MNDVCLTYEHRCSLPFEINLLFMFGCVLSTIRKVLHEVLLKITQVFFMKPCILQTRQSHV